MNNLAPDIDNYNRRRELEKEVRVLYIVRHRCASSQRSQEKVVKMAAYAVKHRESVGQQKDIKKAITDLNEKNQLLQHKLKPVAALKKFVVSHLSTDRKSAG